MTYTPTKPPGGLDQTTTLAGSQTTLGDVAEKVYNGFLPGSTPSGFAMGVNLSALETGLSGTTDYPPIPDESYFKYWSSQGVYLIRLPVKWEYLQPTINTALDAGMVTRIQSVLADLGIVRETPIQEGYATNALMTKAFTTWVASLPTADPKVAGKVWSNADAPTVSQG